MGRGPVSLHDCSPYRRERESKEKHRGQKHCRRIDSPVIVWQAAGEDVGGVDCCVADEPRGEPEVDRIAAVEVARAPPEAGTEDYKGDANIADEMRVEGSRVRHSRRQVQVPRIGSSEHPEAIRDARDTKEPEQGLHQNLLLSVPDPNELGSRKGRAAVHSKLGWSIWGLFAGALMGLGDLLGFLALGLDMRLAGRSVIAEVIKDLLLMGPNPTITP